MTTVIERRVHRRGTAAAWTAANPVLLAGEVGYETDTHKTKLGDGATNWVTLPYDAPNATVLSSTFAPGVSVKGYGAKGDGVTLDHVAINAAITANAGRTIYFPAGIYLIDADYVGGKGVRLNQSGTKLLLDPGATVKVNPNALDYYAAITVTAPDCVIEGGKILGDVGTHTGVTGEWGHGIEVFNTAHRLQIRNILVTKCWGDGILLGRDSFVSGVQVDDVRVGNVACDDNRRQGMSVLGANRLRVSNSAFNNTGKTAFTAPGFGVDVEPNPGGLEVILDAEFTGCSFTGNKGRGFGVNPSGRPTEVRVTACQAVSNLGEGFGTEGVAVTSLISCTAKGNNPDGFNTFTSGGKATYIACESVGNTRLGFYPSDGDVLTGCSASNNGGSGYRLDAVGTRLTGCSAVGNSTLGVLDRQYDIQGAGVILTGCTSYAGSNTTKPNTGFQVTSAASAVRMIGCDASGAFGTAAYASTPVDTFAFPKPGGARPVLTGASTATQIVTALQSLGISG